MHYAKEVCFMSDQEFSVIQVNSTSTVRHLGARFVVIIAEVAVMLAVPVMMLVLSLTIWLLTSRMVQSHGRPTIVIVAALVSVVAGFWSTRLLNSGLDRLRAWARGAAP
jgi:hypothetical protein